MKQSISKMRWVLFLSLYTTQYVGVGFLLVALVGILRQRGAELGDLSIVYALSIPWIFKFTWAPLIDRFGYKPWGHYRGWLLILQCFMVIFLVLLSQLSLDNQLNLIIFIGAIFVTLSATQDIATDALASREFDKQHRGLVNGIQFAGGLLGNVIGGGLVLVLYPFIGWEGSFFLMAGVTAISWILLLFFQESDSVFTEKSLSVLQTFKHLLVFWRGKGQWFLLVFTSNIGFSMVYVILTPMMLDAGKTLSEVGVALNIFGASIGVLSGLLGGWIIQQLGRKLSLQGFYWLQVMCFIAIFPVALSINNFTIYFTMLVYFMVYPLVSAVMSTLMMDYATQGTTPGSDYTIQYTMSFFSGMLMASLGMQVAQYLGYTGVIAVAIGFSLLGLMLAMRYAQRLPKHIHIEN